MTRALRVGAIAAVVLLLTIAARSINPLTTIGDITGDEASYVSMALSLAHDGNLTFEKADLDRFLKIYPRGPEGIFLKRQYEVRPRLTAAWPPIRLDAMAVPTTKRLVYAKPFVYALVAWPFALLGGIGGLLVLNGLLFVICVTVAIRFCQARMGPISGGALGLVFLGASIVPVYCFLLLPEMLNVTLIFVAYFLWLYKEVAPPGAWPGWRRPWTDLAAVVLLGVATYAKPTHILLVGPPVVAALLAGRFRYAVTLTALAGSTAALFFAANIWITGEWNYQGAATADGRKVFYDAFPFDAKGTTYEAYGAPHEAVTNDVGNVDTTTRDVFVRLLPRNLWYFVVGRDAGLLPFFFPGLAITLAWLIRWRRRRVWQLATFAAVVGSAVLFVIIAPYSWNGGGGAPGNRYFLSTYPALLFLVPEGAGLLLAGAAALGLFFTGRLVTSPVVEATEPYLAVGRAPLNWLPVEIPLVNDLPVSLRGEHYFRILAVHEPAVFFYYLDAEPNFWEGQGLWTRGHGVTDILMRTDVPITKLTLRLTDKYVANDVTVTIEGTSLIGQTERAHLEPGGVATLVFTPRPGFWHHASFGIVLHVTTSSGFVPARIGEQPPPGQAPDTRDLGVFLEPLFEVAERPPGG